MNYTCFLNLGGEATGQLPPPGCGLDAFYHLEAEGKPVFPFCNPLPNVVDHLILRFKTTQIHGVQNDAGITGFLYRVCNNNIDI